MLVHHYNSGNLCVLITIYINCLDHGNAPVVKFIFLKPDILDWKIYQF